MEKQPALRRKLGKIGLGGWDLEDIEIVILANKNYPIPARIKAAHRILEKMAR